MTQSDVDTLLMELYALHSELNSGEFPLEAEIVQRAGLYLVWFSNTFLGLNISRNFSRNHTIH
jgi:hypothetical protein